MPGKSAYSFDARFSAIVRSEGVAAIPTSIFIYQGELGISPQEAWLLCVLLSYRWTADNPYPSLRTIAKQSNVSRASIQHYLAGLKEKGFVTPIEQIHDNGGQTSSEYDLDGFFDKLEQIIRSKPRPSRSAGVRPKLSEGVSPVGRPGQPALPKVDTSEEDSDEEETRDDADRFGERLAIGLRQPHRRVEMAQWLRETGADTDSLEKAVRRALATFRTTDNEAEVWLGLERMLR